MQKSVLMNGNFSKIQKIKMIEDVVIALRTLLDAHDINRKACLEEAEGTLKKYGEKIGAIKKFIGKLRLSKTLLLITSIPYNRRR